MHSVAAPTLETVRNPMSGTKEADEQPRTRAGRAGEPATPEQSGPGACGDTGCWLRLLGSTNDQDEP
jgi:hypothetical protein